MTGPRYAAAPIRFLIGVVGLWVVGRGLVLAGWPAPPVLHARAEARQDKRVQIAQPQVPFAPSAVAGQPRRPRLRSARTQTDKTSRDGLALAFRTSRAAAVAESGDTAGSTPPSALMTAIDSGRSPSPPALFPLPASPMPLLFPAGPLPARTASRLSGSAWLFFHGGSVASLAPAGELGGSQAGARLLYRIDGAGRLAASARLSRSLAGPAQTEAALGLDWRPLAGIPLHVTLERRIAIDRGGRNAWTIGLSGGAYAVPLAPKVRLDAYGEAGVVGVATRDLYADGGARITRTLDLGDGRSLGVGAGAWGAAQPDVTRFEVGPSAVLRLPVDHATLAVSLDWRRRFAGKARPGSGPALTIGFDF